ncbi:SPOR domain-containing protein [Sphingomonas sp. VNH70]|uniref:SPOR domain-containing protein n=1 Tax=Sphingomonas silueang TaxID=3156617 RepID=UPI0032B4F5C6
MTILPPLVLLAAVAQDAPPVSPARLDDVGMASRVAGGPGVFVVHRSLAPGSFAEVTSVDTGTTILAEVRSGAALPPDRVAELSAAAAAALGLADAPLVPVRVRPIVPTPQDQTVLRAGGVVRRLDSPQALLAALRRRLPVMTPPTRELIRTSVAPPKALVETPPPAPRPAPRPTPAPQPAGRWFVQVAALSDATRAQALAKSIAGVVRRVGTLYRVQAGPFATRAAADTARASLARRGFGDARTTQQD